MLFLIVLSVKGKFYSSYANLYGLTSQLDQQQDMEKKCYFLVVLIYPDMSS